MKSGKILVLVPALALLLAFFKAQQPSEKHVNEYVNLFIGTSEDHGQLDPAACVPFGMVKLGPDSEPLGHSGYEYTSDLIRGFSHNRIGGVGCRGAGGNVRIKPDIGVFDSQPVKMDKSSERANPGYYAVDLENGIKAEFTATNQVGFHRYTFPKSGSAYLMIDPASTFDRVKVLDHKILSLSKDEISGFVSAENVCNKGAYTTYYLIQADREFEQIEERDGMIYWNIGKTDQTEINVEVTLSPISVAQASKDHEARYANHTFEQARVEASELWSDLLERVAVSGQEEYKTLFYTFLYRSLLTPVNTTSSDNTYKGTDGEVYEVNGYTHYDTWSMWDTYRTKFPLITLLYPGYAQEFVRSIEDLYVSGKHDWAGLHEPVPTVRTEHSIIFLLDAYRKGLQADWEKIYPHLTEEMERLPYNSPDNWLESSYDKMAMSEIAGIVNKPKDHQRYFTESQQYKSTWNQYFKTINQSSDVMHGYGLYEGTIWQYRWHVQFDIPGLVKLLGGKEKAAAELETFFERALYNHGNQPDIHSAYLFNHFDREDLTQKWVTKILTSEMIQPYGTHEKWDEPYQGRIFNVNPKGYFPEMDDDDGTMSAWYVMSAMGLYPLEIGTGNYELTTPIFDKISIHLTGENKLEISKSDGVQTQVKWNGERINGHQISHALIQSGGVLNHQIEKY